MIIDQPGRVTDNMLLLGRHESCVYLVQGKGESMLLGGGMAYIVPDLLRQLQDFAVDERRIGRICILHSHFDHCGAVPFLKKRWPWARVTASARAADLLAQPAISESIGRMNQDAISRCGLDEAARTLGFQFTGIAVEETVSEGGVLECGDDRWNVLEVPGHSSCSIALYLPAQKTLFASDAVGLRQNGVYQPTPNSNYDQYQRSLERLARLEVDALLLEHYGAYLGEDARGFMPNAIAAAGQMRLLIEETYRKTRDIRKCTEEIAAVFLNRSTDAFLSDEVRTIVAGQIVRFIANSIEKTD